ncbi:uncharacterized protein LOC123319434 isoform X3 [Coccinella septempunctata]|uniref:uncharacterized protein LOC123319434 isoform X3 n=1 Tax=Coccinella septempunctata TaxID=41139 RepID=UPI001D0956B7|nr:uncharacterized protein LOC123319434 isoform X3 [Coccinella septempunctata]
MMNGSNNQNDNGMIHPENGGINPHRNVEMDGNHEHAEAVEVDAEPIPDVQWIGPRAHPVLVENYFSVVQHAQRVTLMEQEMSSSSDDGTCFREPAQFSQIVNPEDNSNLSDTLGTGTSSRSDTMHPPSPMEIESFQQPSSSRLNNSLQVSNVFEAFARVASAQSDQAGSSSQDQSSAPSTQTEASGSGQSSTHSGQAATSGTQAIEELRFRYRDDATTIQLLSLEGEGESDGTVSIPVTDEAMFAPRYVLSPNSVERNPMLASLLEKNDNFPDDVVLEGDKGDLYEALLKKHEEAKQVDNSIPREQPLEKGSTIFMESGMTHFRHCDITKTLYRHAGNIVERIRKNAYRLANDRTTRPVIPLALSPLVDLGIFHIVFPDAGGAPYFFLWEDTDQHKKTPSNGHTNGKQKEFKPSEEDLTTVGHALHLPEEIKFIGRLVIPLDFSEKSYVNKLGGFPLHVPPGSEVKMHISESNLQKKNPMLSALLNLIKETPTVMLNNPITTSMITTPPPEWKFLLSLVAELNMGRIKALTEARNFILDEAYKIVQKVNPKLAKQWKELDARIRNDVENPILEKVRNKILYRVIKIIAKFEPLLAKYWNDCDADFELLDLYRPKKDYFPKQIPHQPVSYLVYNVTIRGGPENPDSPPTNPPTSPTNPESPTEETPVQRRESTDDQQSSEDEAQRGLGISETPPGETEDTSKVEVEEISCAQENQTPVQEVTPAQESQTTVEENTTAHANQSPVEENATAQRNQASVSENRQVRHHLFYQDRATAEMMEFMSRLPYPRSNIRTHPAAFIRERINAAMSFIQAGSTTGPQQQNQATSSAASSVHHLSDENTPPTTDQRVPTLVSSRSANAPTPLQTHVNTENIPQPSTSGSTQPFIIPPALQQAEDHPLPRSHIPILQGPQLPRLPLDSLSSIIDPQLLQRLAANRVRVQIVPRPQPPNQGMNLEAYVRARTPRVFSTPIQQRHPITASILSSPTRSSKVHPKYKNRLGICSAGDSPAAFTIPKPRRTNPPRFCKSKARQGGPSQAYLNLEAKRRLGNFSYEASGIRVRYVQPTDGDNAVTTMNTSQPSSSRKRKNEDPSTGGTKSKQPTPQASPRRTATSTATLQQCPPPQPTAGSSQSRETRSSEQRNFPQQQEDIPKDDDEEEMQQGSSQSREKRSPEQRNLPQQQEGIPQVNEEEEMQQRNEQQYPELVRRLSTLAQENLERSAERDQSRTETEESTQQPIRDSVESEPGRIQEHSQHPPDVGNESNIAGRVHPTREVSEESQPVPGERQEVTQQPTTHSQSETDARVNPTPSSSAAGSQHRNEADIQQSSTSTNHQTAIFPPYEGLAAALAEMLENRKKRQESGQTPQQTSQTVPSTPRSTPPRHQTRQSPPLRTSASDRTYADMDDSSNSFYYVVNENEEAPPGTVKVVMEGLGLALYEMIIKSKKTSGSAQQQQYDPNLLSTGNAPLQIPTTNYYQIPTTYYYQIPTTTCYCQMPTTYYYQIPTTYYYQIPTTYETPTTYQTPTTFQRPSTYQMPTAYDMPTTHQIPTTNHHHVHEQISSIGIPPADGQHVGSPALAGSIYEWINSPPQELHTFPPFSPANTVEEPVYHSPFDTPGSSSVYYEYSQGQQNNLQVCTPPPSRATSVDIERQQQHVECPPEQQHFESGSTPPSATTNAPRIIVHEHFIIRPVSDQSTDISTAQQQQVSTPLSGTSRSIEIDSENLQLGGSPASPRSTPLDLSSADRQNVASPSSVRSVPMDISPLSDQIIRTPPSAGSAMMDISPENQRHSSANSTAGSMDMEISPEPDHQERVHPRSSGSTSCNVSPYSNSRPGPSRVASTEFKVPDTPQRRRRRRRRSLPINNSDHMEIPPGMRRTMSFPGIEVHEPPYYLKNVALSYVPPLGAPLRLTNRLRRLPVQHFIGLARSFINKAPRCKCQLPAHLYNTRAVQMGIRRMLAQTTDSDLRPVTPRPVLEQIAPFALVQDNPNENPPENDGQSRAQSLVDCLTSVPISPFDPETVPCSYRASFVEKILTTEDLGSTNYAKVARMSYDDLRAYVNDYFINYERDKNKNLRQSVTGLRSDTAHLSRSGAASTSRSQSTNRARSSSVPTTISTGAVPRRTCCLKISSTHSRKPITRFSPHLVCGTPSNQRRSVTHTTLSYSNSPIMSDAPYTAGISRIPTAHSSNNPRLNPAPTPGLSGLDLRIGSRRSSTEDTHEPTIASQGSSTAPFDTDVTEDTSRMQRAEETIYSQITSGPATNTAMTTDLDSGVATNIIHGIQSPDLPNNTQLTSEQHQENYFDQTDPPTTIVVQPDIDTMVATNLYGIQTADEASHMEIAPTEYLQNYQDHVATATTVMPPEFDTNIYGTQSADLASNTQLTPAQHLQNYLDETAQHLRSLVYTYDLESNVSSYTSRDRPSTSFSSNTHESTNYQYPIEEYNAQQHNLEESQRSTQSSRQAVHLSSYVNPEIAQMYQLHEPVQEAHPTSIPLMSNIPEPYQILFQENTRRRRSTKTDSSRRSQSGPAESMRRTSPRKSHSEKKENINNFVCETCGKVYKFEKRFITHKSECKKKKEEKDRSSKSKRKYGRDSL